MAAGPREAWTLVDPLHGAQGYLRHSGSEATEAEDPSES